MARLKQLEGATLNSTATRTITAVDSVAADHATFTGSHNVNIYGAGAVYIHIGHNNASGSVAGHLCFYDQDDNLIAMGAALTLAATAIQATLTEDDGSSTNTRNLSAAEIDVPTGAHIARFYVTTLTTSTEVDVFIGYTDGFSR